MAKGIITTIAKAIVEKQKEADRKARLLSEGVSMARERQARIIAGTW